MPVTGKVWRVRERGIHPHPNLSPSRGKGRLDARQDEAGFASDAQVVGADDAHAGDGVV